MKTYLIALAASAAFVTAALAGEMPNTDPNMQPAPAAIAAPATTASTPDGKEEAAPAPAAAVSMPDDKAKTEDKLLTNEKPAPVQKRVDEHHAKYHNGEGSTWKTGRNSYGFEGTYGGCQIRGTAGPNGYHIDRAC
ncbi:hypothetical protein [Methyloferula stellata]|uniref:hypothetical protein n=1 Tax=Methyloferula stellata TaxID=876270 RepID=UPI00035CFA63|nr:hypothetical protein [Methyloferula stellata]